MDGDIFEILNNLKIFGLNPLSAFLIAVFTQIIKVSFFNDLLNYLSPKNNKLSKIIKNILVFLLPLIITFLITIILQKGFGKNFVEELLKNWMGSVLLYRAVKIFIPDEENKGAK